MTSISILQEDTPRCAMHKTIQKCTLQFLSFFYFQFLSFFYFHFLLLQSIPTLFILITFLPSYTFYNTYTYAESSMCGFQISYTIIQYGVW